MVRRKSTRVRIPGGAKDWTQVLPEEYRNNPDVIVVCVGRGARTRIVKTPDGFSVGVLEHKAGNRGLQVIGGGGNYLDHQEVIEKHYRLRMADPQYIGKLLRMPESITRSDFIPLIFLRDKMGEPYFNLKHYMYFNSEGDDEQPN